MKNVIYSRGEKCGMDEHRKRNGAFNNCELYLILCARVKYASVLKAWKSVSGRSW